MLHVTGKGRNCFAMSYIKHPLQPGVVDIRHQVLHIEIVLASTSIL